MQQIPIRFQGEQQQYDTSRQQQQQPQWLSTGTQQYQPESYKQGVSQFPQQGQQQEFQPSWKSSQQDTSVWKQGMGYQPQQGIQGQQGFGLGQQQQQQYQQQQGIQGQQTMFQGQWAEKHLQQNNVSVTDVAVLHLLLRLSGICYVKEHILMKLCQDNTGFIRNWHNQVTINNLDVFSKFVKIWGLTLPFPETLEKREHEIKNSLQNVSQVLTLGEALSDICASAHMVHQELSCGYMGSNNEEFKEACKKASSVLCQQYCQLKEAITKTEQFYPLPIVKSVVIHEGVQSRR
jgi:hypothetical protein